MGRVCFYTVLLLSLFLALLFSSGFGRKIADTSVHKENTHAVGASAQEKSREMMELDYEDPGPNTNNQSGYHFPSPPPQPDPGLGF